MKTRILLTTALAVVALGAVGISQHVNAATETADVDARIVVPVTITKTSDLDFGDIAAGTGITEVTIAPVTGARTKDAGDAVLLASDAGNDATFDVDGEDGLTIAVDVPGNLDVVLDNGGGGTMAVEDFTWNFNAVTTTGDGTVALPAGAAAELSLGATLIVGANQAAGTYTDTLTINVNYQ
ncbi:MAG: DUF4402 domain-containing protein [Alphaproteobacteria bacterium]|nr:DUF4402 domain-containing protein [Alphaproteobacteria bacterium]